MIRAWLDLVSLWAIPVLFVAIPLAGLARGVKVYDVFIEGAREGFEVAVRIIPFLVGILVAIGMSARRAAWTSSPRGSRRSRVPPGSGRARAARDPPLAHGERLARLRDGSREGARTRLAHRTHRGDDVRVVRDDLLRARRVLRGGGRAPHAARRPAALVGDLAAALASVAVCGGCSERVGRLDADHRRRLSRRLGAERGGRERDASRVPRPSRAGTIPARRVGAGCGVTPKYGFFAT